MITALFCVLPAFVVGLLVGVVWCVTGHRLERLMITAAVFVTAYVVGTLALVWILDS